MRKHTPQVETQEIADSDLDHVSGGTAVADLLQTAVSDLPAVALPGVAGGAGVQVTGPVCLQASLAGGAAL